MEVDNVENVADDISKSDNFFSDEMSDFGGGWGNDIQIIPSNSQQSSPEVQCNPIQIHNQSVPSNNIRFRGNNRFNGGGRGRGAREANNDNCRFEGNWKQQGSFQQTQIMAGPPPNLQHHSPFNPVQNLWVETKTEDSKSYYYHASTRETTWTRPEGPNVNIMKQNVFEQLSKKQMRPMEQQEPELSDPSKIGIMPPNLAMDTSHMPPLHSNPFSFLGSNIPPQFNNMPPFAMPPPWNSQQPTQWQVSPPNKVMFDKKIDPQILAKAAEWSEHRAPDGRSYYYRASRGESVWERPQSLKDLEDARMAASHSLPPPGLNQMGSSVMTQSDSQLDSLEMSNKLSIGEAEAEKGRKKRELEKRKMEEDVDKIKQQPAKPLDKSRPVSSTPIQGTPWCVVWTGDSRVFFYNPSTRTSVWDRPEELVDRADVDKAVTRIPELLRGVAEDILVEKNNGATVDVVSAETGKKEIAILSETEKNTINEESSEDGDDNDNPSKKSKTDDTITPTKTTQFGTPVEKRIDLVKDGAMEAEVRAAKERAMVPLDVRVKSFKEMLKEKEVSAFSTWEKELHKIVFDPRYLLLASKERKQVFEKYLKDEAEDERRQKRNKLKQKRDEFRALLDHANLHGKSSLSDFCSRYKNDERYKSIEKMRDRENLFNDYLMELRKKEKDEKLNKKEQIRKEFFAMLREHTVIDRHSHWMDIKKKIDQDARYKAVGESILREDYFYDFLKVLKDERKKTKENKKSSKEKKSKKSSKEKKSLREKGKFSDNNETTNSKKSEDDDDSSIKKDDTKKNEEVEDSGKSDSEKDQEDGEHSGASSDIEDTVRHRKERDRQIRAEASIKERGKEVQRTLEVHLRDRDKERQHHKKDEAARHFTALLADLVRNADLTWKEVKKQLKKDHRYELVENLEREEREKLFNDHINLLSKKKRDKFREMLEEIGSLELTSSWKETKRQIREDLRFLKFGSSERCEREFREYVKDKTLSARLAFKELLQECKLLNHKSFDLYNENNNHLKEIEDILKNDKRFLILDHIASERTQMLLSYLDDLKKKGPPPPPTATESIRRK